MKLFNYVRKIACYAVILLLVIHGQSCDAEKDDPKIEVITPKTEIPLEEPDTSFEINIDTSDLSNLVEDTGGTHTAFPLSETTARFGHYVYTPSGYDETGPEYPLLIFLHGWSPSLGNEPLENAISSGPSSLIEAGQWDPTYPFIVVSPQLKTSYWQPNMVHQFIEYLTENYQINTKRIYLTGLSLGGGGCWWYVGEVDDNYAAAIVPISASGAEHLVDNLKKVPIWAFHGRKDTTVEAYTGYGSVPMVQAINQANPTTDARVTVYPNLGHNAWTTTYNGSGRDHLQLHDEYKVDIYDWMLSYKKEE